MKTARFIVVFLCLGALGVLICSSWQADDILVRDQALGDVIHIEKVSLSRGGYLFITGIPYQGFEQRDYLTTGYISPGTYSDVRVNFSVTSSTEKGNLFEPIEPIRPGNYLVAELYTLRQHTGPIPQTPRRDDPALILVKDFWGRPVRRQFSVTLQNDPFAQKDACEKVAYRDRGTCIITVLVNYAKHHKGSPGFMNDFCTVIAPEFKELCYRQVGKSVDSWEKKDMTRSDVCAHVQNNQYKQWCNGQ